MSRRVLVPIVGQGSLIHIIRTGMLSMMRSYCEPVVTLLWNDEKLIKELKNDGIRVVIFPKFQINTNYVQLRRKIDFWYHRFLLKTNAHKIHDKYSLSYKSKKNWLRKNLEEKLLYIRFSLSNSYIQTLISEEKALVQQQPCFEVFQQWIHELEPDGMFTVTPFLQPVELMARILHKKNVPLIASIHSFDNITKRGWPAVFFHHYFVWNKYNKEELQRVNTNLHDQITITGAPQFDFHYRSQYYSSKDEWLQMLGLPKDKKIILYAGGSANLFPDEPQYLKDLVSACEQNVFGKDVIILFRCHPLDKIDRWKKALNHSACLFYSSGPNGKIKLDYCNVTNDDITKLVATLKYSDVHVNLCSTMSVDGSVFHKPQIAPYYDNTSRRREKLLRNMYRQEHYLPVMKSKAIHLAHSKKQLIQLVNDALQYPEEFNENCETCLDEIITFKDGNSTHRVAARLEEFFS